MTKDLKITQVKDLMRTPYLKNDAVNKEMWLFSVTYILAIGIVTDHIDSKDIAKLIVELH